MALSLGLPWSANTVRNIHPLTPILFGLPLGLGPSTSYPCISSPNHASSSKRQINITCEVTCTECLKQKNSKHEKLEAKMCTTYLQNAAKEYKN